MLEWGFIDVIGPDNNLALRNVYTDIIRKIGVKPLTLHKWRSEGRLFMEFVAAYTRAGKNVPHVNFTWLRRHPQSQIQQREALLAQSAWAHIGGPEKVPISEIANWPSYKTLCLSFFQRAGSPIAHPEMWLKFGFCAFNEGDDRDSILLHTLHPSLISKCTFDEFCDAYITSSLLSLMDRKGLKELRSRMPPEFEAVLAQSPDRIPAVWCLK